MHHCYLLLLRMLALHRLMAEYMESAPVSAVGEAVEMLAGPPLLHCVHSRPGAQVAVRVLAQGTAKQRKKVIKAMKGVLPTPCMCDQGSTSACAHPATPQHPRQTALEGVGTQNDRCGLSARAREGHGYGRMGARCAHCSAGFHR